MTREEAEKSIDRVVDIAALAFDAAISSIWESVRRIVNLSVGLRALGPRFVFSASDDLDSRVNEELIALSDSLRNAIFKHLKTAFEVNVDVSEEDKEAAITYISREIEGQNLTARLDGYMSDMKRQLEAYIAAGFYYKIAAEDIVTQYMLNIESPLNSNLMKEAYLNRNDFLTPLIVGLGITYGKGRYVSPLANVKRLEQMSIIEGYDYALYHGWKRKGVENYHVYRGSSYPCAICEIMANRTYPITELVLPFHPNCVCFAVPVTDKAR